MRDLSSGLPVERESVVGSPPTEAFWSENLLFTPYDPASGIGGWLHLGTVPNDWSMWEDRVLLCLPGDEGVLSMWAYHRTPPEHRPAGANLAFECIEPFKHWRVTFDGFAIHTSTEDMMTGRAREGRRQPLSFELDIECLTPAWDAHTAAQETSGKGSMREQGWAKDHYEQLYTATGTVRLESGEVPFNGTGWRDHSRGPRGGGTGAPWGGHVITGCAYPESGRGWGLSRYWTPEGEISLEGGYVVGEDGVLHYAQVVDAPRLPELLLRGEELPIGLRWDGGEIALTLTTEAPIWTSMQNQLAVGMDMADAGLMYVLNWGPCPWDDEVGQAYIERSDMLNAYPATLRHPAS